MKGVIGIDEVGRGPLAGPVTVCAVFIEDKNRVAKDIFGNSIRDSKKIKKSLRNNIYKTIRYKRYLNTRIEYAISSRSATYIDRFGIRKALCECTDECVRGLSKKGVAINKLSIHLDAGLSLSNKDFRQSSHIKGDEQFVEIALASILAKESRDSYMRRVGKQYESYNWQSNAGYGTKEHCEAIRKRGITKHHRRSFLKGFKLFDIAE